MQAPDMLPQFAWALVIGTFALAAVPLLFPAIGYVLHGAAWVVLTLAEAAGVLG